jgi:hypothetical protein
MQMLCGAVLVFGVSNRVLYRMALVPMKDYVFFLAQFQNVSGANYSHLTPLALTNFPQNPQCIYLLVYFGILYYRYRYYFSESDGSVILDLNT